MSRLKKGGESAVVAFEAVMVSRIRARLFLKRIAFGEHVWALPLRCTTWRRSHDQNRALLLNIAEVSVTDKTAWLGAPSKTNSSSIGVQNSSR